MPEVVVRLLEGKQPYVDVVIDVPEEHVEGSGSEEGAAIRLADWARKRAVPVGYEMGRVIRRGPRILIEVHRLEPS